ncbi:MAG: helical backbone metal receptor [Gemmatimonadaceae bacterium]
MRRQSAVAVSAAFLLGVAALGSCGSREVPSRAASVDDLGDSIAIGSATLPSRIISLDPSVTEILFALGKGPQLIGRTHWDLFSDSARAIPDLGDGIRPNVEALLASRPDLVFLYASPENRDAARSLRAAGIGVVSLRIDHIADFGRVTALIGRLTKRSERARQVVDSVTATLDRVRRATATLPHPRVFLHAWESPLLTLGGGSFLSELVSIAGAENVFADLPAPSPQVSFEEVMRRNPDAVLGGPQTTMELGRSARWQALPAVRQGHVLVMDTLIVGKPSVRLGEAAVSLARLFHPGVLE